MSGHALVDHRVLAKHAEDKVNVEREAARRRREQVKHLRTRLETHIAAHPGYDLVKMRGAGSPPHGRRRRGAARRQLGRTGEQDGRRLALPPGALL